VVAAGAFHFAAWQVVLIVIGYLGLESLDQWLAKRAKARAIGKAIDDVMYRWNTDPDDPEHEEKDEWKPRQTHWQGADRRSESGGTAAKVTPMKTLFPSQEVAQRIPIKMPREMDGICQLLVYLSLLLREIKLPSLVPN